MMDVKDFSTLVNQTSDEEKIAAYAEAKKALELLENQSEEDTVHFILYRINLVEMKLMHLLTLVLEVKK